MIYSVVYGLQNQIDTMDAIGDYTFISWKTYPLFFGNAAFLFCIHTVAIPVEQSMRLDEDEGGEGEADAQEMRLSAGGGGGQFEDKDSTAAPAAYASACDKSVVFVGVLNIIYAGVCMPLYRNWTDGLPGGLRGVQGNIVDNLPLQNQLVTACKLCLCVVMLFTFAIFIQPIAELCEVRYARNRGGRKAPMWVSGLIRAGLSLFCCALGLAVPDFSLATGLVGGVSNTLVGVVLPPIFYLKLNQVNGRELDKNEGLINKTVAFFGIVLMVVSTAVTVGEIVNLHSS